MTQLRQVSGDNVFLEQSSEHVLKGIGAQQILLISLRKLHTESKLIFSTKFIYYFIPNFNFLSID